MTMTLTRHTSHLTYPFFIIEIIPERTQSVVFSSVALASERDLGTQPVVVDGSAMIGRFDHGPGTATRIHYIQTRCDVLIH